jgi:hypothetical protein
VPLINTGIGNYNLHQIVAAYDHDKAMYGFHPVYYFFYINDAEPTQIEHDRDFWNGFYTTFLLRRSFFNLRMRFLTHVDYVPYYKATFQGTSGDAFYADLKRLRDATRGQLTVFLLPDFRDLRSNPFAAEFTAIQRYLREIGVPSYDLSGSFKGFHGPELWVAQDDPHPNQRAHEILANELAKRLSRGIKFEKSNE